MFKLNAEKLQPYRFLFPVGILGALIGATLWILFNAGVIQYYPKYNHANIMYYAFMWSFVAGFLMTAVPKMTSTDAASVREIIFASLLVCLQFVVNLTNLSEFSNLVYVAQILFLLAFVVRRFLVNRTVPFSGFIFIPFAMILALIGSAYNILNPTMASYLVTGEAFIFNLILGIGSRLIPVLSRLPNALTPDIKSQKINFTKNLVLAILLNCGFVVEFFGDVRAGYLLKGIVFTYVSCLQFGFLKFEALKSKLGLGLKIAQLFVYIAIGMILLSPQYYLAAKHLIYLGFFSLVTIMVATRVMLAHGGQNLDYEIHSKRLIFVVLLFVLSTVFRFVYTFVGQAEYVSLAAACFFAALMLWTYKFITILSSEK